MEKKRSKSCNQDVFTRINKKTGPQQVIKTNILYERLKLTDPLCLLVNKFIVHVVVGYGNMVIYSLWKC